MKLDHVERADLREAMLESFTTLGDLDLFVQDHLNVVLSHVVTTTDAFGVVCQNFIRWAEDRGRLATFLEEVVADRDLPHLHPIATGLIARAQAAAAADEARTARLTALICDTFPSVDELEQVVVGRLPERLYTDYVAPGLPLPDTVSRLLREMEGRGLTTVLLQALVDARPQRTEFHTAVKALCPEVKLPRPEVVGVSIAVGELGNLLASPGAGAQIASSRGEIARLSHDIGMLTRYKKLHDCLHQIQLKHYRLLMDAVRRFRTDPLSYSTLQEYLYQLRVQVADARSAAAGLPDTPTARQQETLWIDTLELVVESLRKALDDYEEPVAAEGILRLKGILRVQPARLNQFLALTVKGLPLERLRDTLERVASGLDPAQAGDLRKGIDGLRALIPDLLGKVQEHLAWQDLERDLWQTEDILHQGNADTMDEFWFLWPAVKSRMQSLTAADPAAKWAVDIVRAMCDFDVAFPAPSAPLDPMRARNAFDRFRRAALHRFYLVDKSLLEKCEQVTLIRQPLNELLEKIPHV